MPFTLPRPAQSVARQLLATLVFIACCLMAAAQTPVTLYNFKESKGDVATPVPYGVVAQGRDGKLYGANHNGGANGAGGIYSISSAGVETVIYSFPSNYISCQPGLTLARDGNFYGDCLAGGANGYGLLYRVTPTGTFTNLHDFTAGTDGGNPNGPPVLAKDGNLYGATTNGGPSGNGVVYKLSATTGTVTPIYSFTGGADGAHPSAPLVQGSDGNLYGTAQNGGAGGSGVIFKMTTSGKIKVIHTFTGSDGNQPIGALAQAADGSFFGTTYQGGANSAGTVFRVTSAGSYKLLHSFSTTSGGQNPETALVLATDGNFYGTTNTYLATQDSLFKVTQKGVYSNVYTFDGTSSTLGVGLANGPVQHTNGILYGATSGSAGTLGDGTIYSLTVAAAKPYARLVTTAGPVGTSIGILGQGFKSTSIVKFNGVQVASVSGSSTYLAVSVPNGALTGAVTVTTGTTTLTSNQSFLVSPKITSLTPTHGVVGTPVKITGTGLTQATAVTFGGVAATFTVNSDVQITATVPAGAVTGSIGVVTPGGSSSSSTAFTVQ